MARGRRGDAFGPASGREVSLASALAVALRERGVPDPAATLAAEAGVAVFKVAFERWLSRPGARPLPDIIAESVAELKSVTAG